MKKTRAAFISSLMSVILCFTMLLGSTFAWFTDTVSNTGNKIHAGTLDVGLEQYKITDEKPDGDWFDISGDDKPVFNSGEGTTALWEPGYSQYAVLRVTNKGSLALKYKLLLNVNGTLELNDEGHSIADAIDVYGFVAPTEADAKATYGKTSFDEFKAIEGVAELGTLSSLLFDEDGAAYGVLLPKDSQPTEDAREVVGSAYAVLCLHMREEAGNEYQGMKLANKFDITLNATQYTYEKDGFGSKDYDELANGNPDHSEFDNPTYPVTKLPIKTTVEEGGSTEVTQEQTIQLPSGMKIEYPAGVPLTTTPTTETPGNSTNKAAQGFEFKNEEPVTETVSNIIINDSNKAVARYELTLPIKDTNTKLVKTTDKIVPGYINLKVYHNGTEITKVESSDATPTVESFYYNPETGEFVLWVFHASPIEFVYDIIPPVPALETKDEIKAAMAAAKSGDTLKIKAGQYYFGEGLSVQEGVNIVSDSSDDVFIVIPRMYVGNEDIGYIENETKIETNKTYKYGFEIYSNAFEDLSQIESLNAGFACSCGGYSASGISGQILASNHILLTGCSVSHDFTTCTDTEITISFGDPSYSFEYTYKCKFD